MSGEPRGRVSLLRVAGLWAAGMGDRAPRPRPLWLSFSRSVTGASLLVLFFPVMESVWRELRVDGVLLLNPESIVKILKGPQ